MRFLRHPWRETAIAWGLLLLLAAVAFASELDASRRQLEEIQKRIAQLQVEEGAVGIAAAKVTEAEVFADHGIEDIVVAYPVFGEPKWQKMAKLAQRCRLTAHAENPKAVEGLSRAATEQGVHMGVRVELDTGLHRTGVSTDEAVDLASLIEKSSGIFFDGLTSHRSIFFAGATGRDREELAYEEGEIMVRAAETLRSRGIEVPNVVAGSTPTAEVLAGVDGITEVCAGTYAFYDAGMADLGVASYDDIALSISTSVVSHMGSDRYTVDGGAKTFTKDTYPGSGPPIHGRAVGRDAVVVAVTDEHGVVETRSGSLPPHGDLVYFYPMHVCPVVNLADELIVTRQGEIEDVWTVRARGTNR